MIIKPRILVVEDNDDLRDMFQQTFAAGGFDVLVATSGAEGLDLAAVETLDAVLTDFEIPGMSGIEFCRQFKHETAYRARTTPVWLMTGLSDETITHEAHAAGVTAILRKPFRVESACEKILSVLTARGLQDQPARHRIAV